MHNFIYVWNVKHTLGCYQPKVSLKLTCNSVAQSTTVNNILSDEAEERLKQDEAEFIKKYRSLGANERSHTEWRAARQLDLMVQWTTIIVSWYAPTKLLSVREVQVTRELIQMCVNVS